MIVDSSALLSILQKEDDYVAIVEAMNAAEEISINAATLLETSMVVAGKTGPNGLTDLDRLLAEAEVDVVPFTASHAAVARDAFLRFGKGRHAAGLNFGDCIAYATAKLASQPLLFKGDDFQRTDIESAL